MTSLTGYPSLPIAEQVRPRPIQLQDRYRKVGKSLQMRMRTCDFDWVRVLIHLRYPFILLRSAKPILFFKHHKTPSPSSQNSVASACFLRYLVILRSG